MLTVRRVRTAIVYTVVKKRRVAGGARHDFGGVKCAAFQLCPGLVHEATPLGHLLPAFIQQLSATTRTPCIERITPAAPLSTRKTTRFRCLDVTLARDGCNSELHSVE